jgi:glycolate oxidase iron-sulfur subunit
VIAGDAMNRVAFGHRTRTYDADRERAPRCDERLAAAEVAYDAARMTTLDLDAEELNMCVSCGLCLPHCPTYRVTGDEARSPRGRIDAMRAVELRGAPIDDDFVDVMDTCVQCRGCEPACPSGVPFGSLIETTRVKLATNSAVAPRWQRRAFSYLPRHRLLLLGSSLLALAQRLHLAPRRLRAVRVPLRRGSAVGSTARATDTDAWLFTGCVMDAWQRSTHRSTAAVLTALGLRYTVPAAGGGCCGALHAHAGLHDDAVDLAERVMASMPGEAPVVVNSAGCGAAMKDYGKLLDTPEAHSFALRVVDVSEFVVSRADDLPELRPRGDVIVHDPCHLRHVQGCHLAVRDLVERFSEVVELDDDGLCCGAGGAYSAVQPELAGQILDRKLEAFDRSIARSQALVAVSANPGCSMHLERSLAERGVRIVHPIDLLAEALP